MFQLHDLLDDLFHLFLLSREVTDCPNHLVIGFPFALQILGLGILDVIRLGNLVQPIDAGNAILESFLEMRPRTQVLIPRAMKLDPCPG